MDFNIKMSGEVIKGILNELQLSDLQMIRNWVDDCIRVMMDRMDIPEPDAEPDLKVGDRVRIKSVEPFDQVMGYQVGDEYTISETFINPRGVKVYCKDLGEEWQSGLYREQLELVAEDEDDPEDEDPCSDCLFEKQGRCTLFNKPCVDRDEDCEEDPEDCEEDPEEDDDLIHMGVTPNAGLRVGDVVKVSSADFWDMGFYEIGEEFAIGRIDEFRGDYYYSKGNGIHGLSLDQLEVIGLDKKVEPEEIKVGDWVEVIKLDDTDKEYQYYALGERFEVIKIDRFLGKPFYCKDCDKYGLSRNQLKKLER